MDWAAIAKAPAPQAVPDDDGGLEKPRVAVVDANAIITQHGLLNLARFADKCVMTPEVLREVRDKQSRQALAALPFTLQTQEPLEESVKAGTWWAGGGGWGGVVVGGQQGTSAAAAAPATVPFQRGFGRSGGQAVCGVRLGPLRVCRSEAAPCASAVWCGAV